MKFGCILLNLEIVEVSHKTIFLGPLRSEGFIIGTGGKDGARLVVLLDGLGMDTLKPSHRLLC
jgi:hypothetical protein